MLRYQGFFGSCSNLALCSRLAAAEQPVSGRTCICRELEEFSVSSSATEERKKRRKSSVDVTTSKSGRSCLRYVTRRRFNSSNRRRENVHDLDRTEREPRGAPSASRRNYRILGKSGRRAPRRETARICGAAADNAAGFRVAVGSLNPAPATSSDDTHLSRTERPPRGLEALNESRPGSRPTISDNVDCAHSVPLSADFVRVFIESETAARGRPIIVEWRETQGIRRASLSFAVFAVNSDSVTAISSPPRKPALQIYPLVASENNFLAMWSEMMDSMDSVFSTTITFSCCSKTATDTPKRLQFIGGASACTYELPTRRRDHALHIVSVGAPHAIPND
ncbi:hypothetical protein EVAR_54312_1 [Eumeta japonica]|uniref:Uncharacterized protein n=1 Tax=Eumeta variegata TaxID=151549 RepID=A0A4C1Z232_EUMVA|nr:hypothetical protein EVAR_54312_1 [Eumeta japonica]